MSEDAVRASRGQDEDGPPPRPTEGVDALPDSPGPEDTEVSRALDEAALTPDEALDELDAGAPTPTVEDLLVSLEATVAQRDEFLALAQSRQAEFENFRKRMMKQQTDEVARATGRVVEELLPVLDAFDYGIGHGDEGLLPMRSQLLGVLERHGLERLDPTEAPFDPTEHDAVAHEPGEDGAQVVAETLRAGYRWGGRVLRPAMVKVRG